MKIGFDAKRYFFNQSGLGNYSREIVAAIMNQFPENEYFLFSPESKSEFLQNNSPLSESQIVVPSFTPFLWREYFINKAIQRNKIDLFHGLSNEIPIHSAKNTKLVCSIHDVIYKKFPLHYRYFDRLIYDFKTNYAVKQAHQIIACSKATASDLIKYYDANVSKLEVVYQPIKRIFYEKHSLSPKFDKKIPYLIYASGFQARKNHSILIEAFAKIFKQVECNLYLVGNSGPTLESCMKFIEHEKLTDRIFIFNRVSEKELAGLLQNAMAFIYPSMVEGFGIPLAEAAVSGIPIAASNIPVFNELAEKNALYFNCYNAAEIADAMLQMQDDSLRRQLSKYNNIILNKIEPKKIANEINELYHKVV